MSPRSHTPLLAAFLACACILWPTAGFADAAPTAPAPSPAPYAVAPVALSAPATSGLATDAEAQNLEDRLHNLQELLNQVELQAEETKAALDKSRPQPISFGQGQLLLQEAIYGPDFSTAFGTQALLGFNLNPASQVHGDVDVELLGSVAPDRLLPQQEASLLYTDNERVVLKKTEIIFDTDDAQLRAFRMVPHADFYEQGDMYYLFPAADDTNKYFRQSGRAVPNGYEVNVHDGWFKGLDVWGGDELLYGVTEPTGFARYANKLGPVQFALMGLWEQDPNFNSGQIVVSDQEAWARIPVGQSGLNLDVVGVREATEVGQSYIDVKQVAAGQGVDGSSYSVENVTTTAADAYGGIVRLHGLNALPLLDEETLLGEYSGPLAGNRERINGLLSFRPQRYFLVSVEGTWQQPLVGPNPPPVIIGTPALNFGPIPGTGPRPYGSVVTVSQNPISGINNREMTEAVVTLEFNPGRGWFYKYRPRIVDAWNFNTDLDTPLSNALSVRAWDLPTGTDLGSYISSAGLVVPEPIGSPGLAPSNGWLKEAKDILAFSTGPAHWWLVGAVGDQVAGLSPNFAESNVWANEYLTGDASVRVGAWTLSGGYAENVYGPDDWYQVFGVIIGNRYRASLAWSAGASSISVRYEGWRDKDATDYHFTGASVPTSATTTYTASAPIDQTMVSYTLNF